VHLLQDTYLYFDVSFKYDESKSALTLKELETAVNELVFITVKADAPEDATVGKKIETPAEVKYRVPPAFAASANEPAVETVAVPAVIVQIPAPMFWINRVSPAENKEVLTVIVVALAEFITTRVPLSAATRTYETVLVLTVWL
jgi:hypothetical protein